MTPFPSDAAQIDSWILARRPARNDLDPQRPHAFFLEQERSESGEVVDLAAIFLTNRECPWRCLMCDLWRNTLPEAVPIGAIPAQIDYALARLPTARQVKLYNSGSFFDRGAIPPEDYSAIAQRLRGFERVIVESHPALVGDACLRFRDLLELHSARGLAHSKSFDLRKEHQANARVLDCASPLALSACRPEIEPTDSVYRQGEDVKTVSPRLEVAMGLETAHPEVLARLNKRMTLDQFARAAALLRENQIALRVFILVKPPFLDEEQALHWAKRSLDFAFDCRASVASLIPTRFGNGALEALAEQGQFSPPKLRTLEQAAEYGVRLGRGRVFADLWDLQKFSACSACFPARLARLRQMNYLQSAPPPVVCGHCEDK